jgi:uncharacterized damage-inducible protein DinB
MTVDLILKKLDDSRNWFWKLLEGLRDDQWEAKPYPTVKSIRETLAHLVIDDRCFKDMLERREPDYEALAPGPNLSAADLVDLLKRTHEEKLSDLRGALAGRDLFEEVDTVYSGRQPLWWEVLSFATEDWYHIGQVSMIRQGTDPSWDYYAHFYSA